MGELHTVTPRVEDELRALIRVTSAVAAAHRLEDVLETVAEVSCGMLRAASVSVSRWEREHNRLRTLINVGTLAPGEERWPDAELWPLDDFPHIPALLRGRPLLPGRRSPIPRSPRASARCWTSSARRRACACRSSSKARRGGSSRCSRTPASPPFTLADAPFVEALATQVAVAIGRAELFSTVETLAYEDPLTGLANRRALEERLEAAVGAAAIAGSPLALLFCDLDGLKEINDADGHEAGDAALLRVAAALRAAAAAHEGAFISRIGGDEFCVLLEGHAAGVARELALDAERRLRAR